MYFYTHPHRSVAELGGPTSMTGHVLSASFLVFFATKFAAAQPTGYVYETKQHEGTRGAQFTQQPTGPVPMQGEYRFPLQLAIRSVGYNNGTAVDETRFVFHINPVKGWMASESSGGQGLMLYDLTGSALLMLNMKARTGMAMHLGAVASQQAESRRQRSLGAPGDNHCSCNKTGRKKLIQGFQTEEYICINGARRTRHEMWVTKELKTDLAPPGSQCSLNGFFYSAGRLGGVPLEGSYYESSILRTTMQLTGVDRTSPFLIRTGEFRFSPR